AGFRDGFGGRQERGRPDPRGRQAPRHHGLILSSRGSGPSAPTLDNPIVVCYKRHMDIKYTFRDGSEGGDDVFEPFGVGSATAAIHEEEDIREFAVALMNDVGLDWSSGYLSKADL